VSEKLFSSNCNYVIFIIFYGQKNQFENRIRKCFCEGDILNPRVVIVYKYCKSIYLAYFETQQTIFRTLTLKGRGGGHDGPPTLKHLYFEKLPHWPTLKILAFSVNVVRKLFSKVLGREISCLTAWRLPQSRVASKVQKRQNFTK